MICVDTTVLIDEFRAKGDLSAPVNRGRRGEFLDGAAMVSPGRVQEALFLLRRRNVVPCDIDTAEHYGSIASLLRRARKLDNRSHNDNWIAATAKCHGARLLTRNPKHFHPIDGLAVIGY